MSVMDKFLEKLQYGGSEEEGYEDYDEVYDERGNDQMKEGEFEEKPKKPATKLSSMKQRRPANVPNGMEVCVMRPTSIDDGRNITDTLNDNRTVVLNLEGLDVAVAQRIIDFASGSCYAIKGNMQKISNYIFVITPASIDISGDLPETMTSGGALDVPPIQEY